MSTSAAQEGAASSAPTQAKSWSICGFFQPITKEQNARQAEQKLNHAKAAGPVLKIPRLRSAGAMRVLKSRVAKKRDIQQMAQLCTRLGQVERAAAEQVILTVAAPADPSTAEQQATDGLDAIIAAMDAAGAEDEVVEITEQPAPVAAAVKPKSRARTKKRAKLVHSSERVLKTIKKSTRVGTMSKSTGRNRSFTDDQYSLIVCELELLPKGVSPKGKPIPDFAQATRNLLRKHPNTFGVESGGTELNRQSGSTSYEIDIDLVC
eukprot:2658494-Rhodomonas_salina.2